MANLVSIGRIKNEEELTKPDPDRSWNKGEVKELWVEAIQITTKRSYDDDISEGTGTPSKVETRPRRNTN